MDKVLAQWESLLAWGESHPQLFVMLISFVVWPMITGAVSFAQDWIKANYPKIWDFMQHNGFDALGYIRKAWPKRLPPPPPDDSGPPPAGGAGIVGAAASAGMVLLFSACVPILGCASLEHTGAAVANYQADLLNQAAPILREKCEEPAKVVETKEKLAKLEEVCVPAASAYDATRIAHAVLVAALQAAVAGDSSGLVAAVQKAAAEGVKLGQALGGLK